ncbi:MAG: GGDEF domain-containing protein [Eubacterium sp.]|nr:GGDEF domain-containing protein [Eubacterium sp.]
MMEYFISYATTNVVGIIIFGILLAHDLAGIDRQEKQVKYDRVLVAFMLYFLSDSIWAGVDSGVLPVNMYTAAATDFANYINMTLTMYTWLDYVMALEHVPHRNRPINKFAVVFPFLAATAALIVTFIVAPHVLIDADYKATPVFYGFMLFVPYIYIVAEIIYTMKKALHEESRILRRKHILIGLFPILVVAGGLFQTIVIPELPVYCYSSIILMIIFYLNSMDENISTDPLTRLNNRGQLMRFVSQPDNLRLEGRPTFVMMLDVNDFKSINDRYGHAEGDSALVITAESLTDAVKSVSFPVFLSRYGGDEFVIIACPSREDEMAELISSIRERISEKCRKAEKPYNLSVSVGYDELLGEQDTFQECLRRADNRQYMEKEHMKLEKL